jgi:hypothetical protein
MVFLDIPAELRNQIYGYLLRGNEGSVLKFVPKTHFKAFGSSWTGEYSPQESNSLDIWDLQSMRITFPVALFRTCRQVHDEVVPLAYAQLRICLIMTDLQEAPGSLRALFDIGDVVRFRDLPKAQITRLDVFLWPRYFLASTPTIKCSESTLKTLKTLPNLKDISCCVVFSGKKDNEHEFPGYQLTNRYMDVFGFAYGNGERKDVDAMEQVPEAVDLTNMSHEAQAGLTKLDKTTVLPTLMRAWLHHLPSDVVCHWTDGSEHKSPNHKTFFKSLGQIETAEQTDEDVFKPTDVTRKAWWFRDITGPRDYFSIVPKNVLDTVHQHVAEDITRESPRNQGKTKVMAR